MRLLTYIVFGCFISASAVPSFAAPPPRYTQVELFKNWALSQCIAKAFDSKDAAATAGGYLEQGSFPPEAYEAADRLIEQDLKKQYLSVEDGVSLNTMKCIDLFHSPALATLARQYSAR